MAGSYPGSGVRGYPNKMGLPKVGGVRRGGQSTGVGGAMGQQGSMVAAPPPPLPTAPPPAAGPQGWWDWMFGGRPAAPASPQSPGRPMIPPVFRPGMGGMYMPGVGDQSNVPPQQFPIVPNPRQYPEPVGGPDYDRRDPMMFPNPANIAEYNFSRGVVGSIRDRANQPVLPQYQTPAQRIQQNVPTGPAPGYQFGQAPQASPRAPYGPGGASGVMERAPMPSQPVDGRYAVAPQGQFAQGGRYVMPGSPGPTQPAAAPDTRSLPAIGPDGTGFMMIGGRRRQFVQLPGRDTPTMVPDGMMVRQSPDGGMEIVDGQGNADPRYNRALPGSAYNGQVRGGIVNPVMRTQDAAGNYVPVGAIPKEEWAYRRGAAQRAREEKAAIRDASALARRFPGNGGRGFGTMNPFESDQAPPAATAVASAEAGPTPALPAMTAVNNPISMAVAQAMSIPGLANNPARMEEYLVGQGFDQAMIRAWVAAQESEMSGPWDSTFGRITNRDFRRRWGGQRGSFIPGQAPASTRPGGYAQSYGMGQR